MDVLKTFTSHKLINSSFKGNVLSDFTIIYQTTYARVDEIGYDDSESDRIAFNVFQVKK